MRITRREKEVWGKAAMVSDQQVAKSVGSQEHGVAGPCHQTAARAEGAPMAGGYRDFHWAITRVTILNRNGLDHRLLRRLFEELDCFVRPRSVASLGNSCRCGARQRRPQASDAATRKHRKSYRSPALSSFSLGRSCTPSLNTSLPAAQRPTKLD